MSGQTCYGGLTVYISLVALLFLYPCLIDSGCSLLYLYPCLIDSAYAVCMCDVACHLTDSEPTHIVLAVFLLLVTFTFLTWCPYSVNIWTRIYLTKTLTWQTDTDLTDTGDVCPNVNKQLLLDLWSGMFYLEGSTLRHGLFHNLYI